MTLDEVVQALDGSGLNPHQNGRGWVAQCPLHQTPVEMTVAQDGGVIAFGCPERCAGRIILEAIGVHAPKLKPRILSHGAHGETERGTDVFSDDVIRAIPPKTIYRRGDDVGRIIGDNGEAQFIPFNPEAVRLLVDAHVALEKTVKGDRVFTSCTKDHAILIREAARRHPAVAPLTQIVKHPVLVPEGGLAQPGMNACGYFYDQPPRLRGLKPFTDRDECVAVLVDAMIDFPFASESDFWNFVGFMLTPIIRPIVQNAPIHLVHATRPRTGKSLLVEVVFGYALFGQPQSITLLPEKEDDRQKKIFSYLREGKTVLNFDNVADFIDSPAIAALLTASAIEDRPMREHQIISVPNRVSVVISGNQVKATEEIVERCVPILLQSTLEEPSERDDFQHPDLHGYMLENGVKILSALLGLATIWDRQGGTKHRMGGFDSWASTVGGILHDTPWMDNARRWRRDANPHREDLHSFIKLWHAEAATFGRPASDLYAIAEKANLFPACSRSPTPQGRIQSFVAKVLRPTRDSNVAGFYIRRQGSDSASFWALEPAS